MHRLFLLAFAFVVVLGASLGAFLFASLWPYYSLIGKFTAGVVGIGLLCVAALMLAFTYNKITSWSIRRRLVVFGEIGAYRELDGTWTHLSGIHQQMSLPVAAPQQYIDAPKEQDVDIELILEMYRKGTTLENIAKATGASYYRVQKITSEYKRGKLGN